MDYFEIYKNFVNKENEQKIIDVLKKEEEWDALQITKFSLIPGEKFSYILLETNLEGSFAAAMFGIFIKGTYIDNFAGEFFYLPVILTTSHAEKMMEQLTTLEQSIKHELCHVEDILQWISEEPDYISNARKYTMSNRNSEVLKESIFFELRKLFKLEPRAFSCDFKAGETSIQEHFLFIRLEYKCETVQEYITWGISSYIERLADTYKDAFQEKSQCIGQYFAEAIDLYGKEILGDDPNAFLKEFKETKVAKLLGSVRKKQ
jgi:hypothetical protein